MRIICPDCDAQYEVPDEVIPEEGRDVQCSNCGTTWMFEHPDFPGAARLREDDEDGAEIQPLPTPPRRELDPEVAGILRAEAEREVAARAADQESTPLEVQPDLGLTEGRPTTARAETDAPDAADPQVAGVADTSRAGNMTVARAAAIAGQRGRLPDVDEIKSSLRSSDDAETKDDADGEALRERGFRRGILVAVLVFVACLLVYRYAPEIAEAVPQTDPWLTSYVTWVDDMRGNVDTQLRAVLAWLDGQAATGQ